MADTARGVVASHAQREIPAEGVLRTYVNGTRVSQQEVTEGDIITIGRSVAFRLSADALTGYVDGGR